VTGSAFYCHHAGNGWKMQATHGKTTLLWRESQAGLFHHAIEQDPFDFCCAWLPSEHPKYEVANIMKAPSKYR
jgi:hypothetical protein